MNNTAKLVSISINQILLRYCRPGFATTCGCLVALAFLLTATVLSTPAHSFAGIEPNVACSDFINSPQRFVRHRDGVITYRISQNFKARYPDSFSQYLVEDVARWWQDYISGFLWTNDISNRFSYYRNDPNEPVYELKSVLLHEFGHAMGMQHSDACFYNNNSNTGMPWNSNFRTAGGGSFSIAATLGSEVMNEVPTASSPGQKAQGPIDGYFRTPGRDAFEFMNSAYPFQSLSLQEIQSGTPVILVDSTDAGMSGGQTSFPGGFTNIAPGDNSAGWFIDGANIWVGNNIGLKSRSEGWMIENFTGFDLRQITLRVNGTSTRRAISESAPPFFTQFGTGLTSSPEQLIFSWSTPPAGPWPPTASGWLSLQLDVHDWTVEEALIWANSNQAFPLAVSTFVAQKPWGLASPKASPPGLAATYSVAANLSSEVTPEPDNIELIPPLTQVNPSGIRGFTAFLPDTDDTEIVSFDLLPINWATAELLARHSSQQRNTVLMQRFEREKQNVTNLAYRGAKKPSEKMTPGSLGFSRLNPRKVAANDGHAKSKKGSLLEKRVKISLSDSQTYAVRLIAKNRHARVTSVSMPELTTYQGTRLTRCEATGDMASCCPVEMTRPHLRIAGLASSKQAWHWSSAGLKEPRCIVANERDDWIQLAGSMPHFLSSGDGDDLVHASQAGSIVLLGSGDDAFSATRDAPASIRGGDGKDRISTSSLDDHVDSGAGNDVIIAREGNDIVLTGADDDFIDAGPGDDQIFPGSGRNYVIAGSGDDQVIFSHACELRSGSVVLGGPGNDTLVLPVSKQKAERSGLRFIGFESIVENAVRHSRFSDCE